MSNSDPRRHLSVHLPADVKQAVVRLVGVHHAEESFTVRVLARNDGSGEWLRAGTFYMYGHGEAAEQPLQSDGGGGTRALEPFDTLVDLTPAVVRLAKSQSTLELWLVVADLEGQPLPDELFRFERMELELT
jgi:hypothetical protein